MRADERKRGERASSIRARRRPASRRCCSVTTPPTLASAGLLASDNVVEDSVDGAVARVGAARRERDAPRSPPRSVSRNVRRSIAGSRTPREPRTPWRSTPSASRALISIPASSTPHLRERPFLDLDTPLSPSRATSLPCQSSRRRSNRARRCDDGVHSSFDRLASPPIAPVQTNPASDASIVIACSVRRVRPAGSERESHKFQAPVTVFTVNSAPMPVATATCARLHAGALIPVHELIAQHVLGAEQRQHCVAADAMNGQPLLVPLAVLDRVATPARDGIVDGQSRRREWSQSKVPSRLSEQTATRRT